MKRKYNDKQIVFWSKSRRKFFEKQKRKKKMSGFYSFSLTVNRQGLLKSDDVISLLNSVQGPTMAFQGLGSTCYWSIPITNIEIVQTLFSRD